MPAIPLGLSAYRRADMPPVTLKNMVYEKTPANLEDQVALMPRPRLVGEYAAGNGPIRGVFRKGGAILDRLLALSGDKLFRVEEGSATEIGTVAGPGRMSAEGSPSAVMLTCGTTVYSTDGASLNTVAIPDNQNIIAVDILNSYFLLAAENFGRFYWSAIGGTTVDPLDYATAESQPDTLQTIKVIGDVAWMVGRLSLEAWQPTGDLDLPFQRISGRIFGIGCVARETVQKLSVGGVDTMCWVGADGVVYRLSPNPTRISDYGMEERIRRADPATLYAVTAKWVGRDFYILHIPGEGSWACDLSTGFWDEWTSYGRDVFRGAVSTVGPDDLPLIGDDETGVIWGLTEAQRTDGSDPVVFEFSGLLENIDAPQRCNNVLLDCSTGLAPDPEDDPMIAMAYSPDRGKTWVETPDQPLGRQGEYVERVMWPRLGLIKRPGRSFRWRTTEPITVRKARFNESYR